MKETASEPMYRIPQRYRRMENLHIVFWLLKDVSWCMLWPVLGIVMILPTLTIAIVICWQTRHLVAELIHNLAVACWITANSYWMITEFLHIDEKTAIAGITYKHLTIIPFTAGLIILGYYYLYLRRRKKPVIENEMLLPG